MTPTLPAPNTALTATPLISPWAALVDSLPHPTWIVELASQSVVAINAAAAALLGQPVAALLGQSARQLLPTPEDSAFWDDASSGAPCLLTSDTVLCGGDGRSVPVTRSIRPLSAAGANAGPHCVVVVMDRSAEQRAEEQHEDALADLQATLEATADGILVTDMDGHVRAFNHRFAQIWSLPQDLLTGGDERLVQDWMCTSVVDGAAYEQRLATLEHATLMSSTERIELKSGRMLERVTRPLWRRGRRHGRVFSFRDLTERLAADQRIEQLARTDSLTGLPNRTQLAERVEAAGVRWRRDGHGFALLVIDLDRFRQVNDSLGYAVGDRVLLDVAQRILGCMRQHDVLARTGGDHFAVLIHGATAAAAEATARRVLNVVAQPCNVEGAQFTLTCSIGVALCPDHGQAIDELTRHAEAAMRVVKTGGRGSYRLHQARAEVDLRSHMKLDHAMRQALVSGRFRLHYQPQVSLLDGRMVGGEALIRWRDPELGDVPPGRFIPVAEDSGFIVAIGDWVLSQAVRQAALWHERGTPVPIAVNVSALQFQQGQFVERVASVLAVSGLPPHLLELELTESILVRDADEALQRLHALARLGVRLAIDDFGTGYSSLSYLKRFPIGKLKIDRSFIQGLPGEESDAGIVRAILQMAHALGMKVIAEGVETELQRQFLVDNGCHEFQGFLFARALDSLSFEKRLDESRAVALPAPAPPVEAVEAVAPAPVARIRLVKG